MTYVNSADPDQTEGAVWSGSTLFAIPLSIKKLLHEKQNLDQNSMALSVWNFRTFTV